MITVHDVQPVELDWERRLLRNNNKEQTIKSCSLNVRLILENHPLWKDRIGFCEFSYKIVKRQIPPLRNASRGEWEDVDTAQLRHWVAEYYGFEPKPTDVEDALLTVARGAPFHVVRDYLKGLDWDERPRIDTWLIDYLGVEEKAQSDEELQRRKDYLRAVGRMWLIAAVARVMRPPVKADCVLILEGEQGTYKSTAIRVLCGDDWFTDSPFDLGQKDGYEHIRGKWVIELAELDSFNKAESTRAKQFFGSLADRFRPSYARRAADFPRQCVFVGTTNQHLYLRDGTGNRRYWPISCGEINLEGLRADRDQLWAEAVHRLAAGERWWPEAEDAHLFATEQDDRYDEDAWESPILDWLALKASSEKAKEEGYSIAEIMEQALGMDTSAIRRQEQSRVGHIMSRSGWVNERISRNGSQKRVWRPRMIANLNRKT